MNSAIAALFMRISVSNGLGPRLLPSQGKETTTICPEPICFESKKKQQVTVQNLSKSLMLTLESLEKLQAAHKFCFKA